MKRHRTERVHEKQDERDGLSPAESNPHRTDMEVHPGAGHAKS